ncbi:GAK system ATP-grasp enzyme [Pseudenhygromyxa sp. WMMC2535]|uniref:GAK system ATP-grasp enzyme n=1 Tax=Pseudenhygromyxa sp. WMMC2535 TaxID=2712867 RepID=UPI00155612DE|nr:GAK system ATP-grasp enzyme [Pseudenhygromyxa sp. WMMC2535]NVB42459.1 GAK system ATP-grasp enzyme [Pseudenhygromyxa sp. WMMC2535]
MTRASPRIGVIGIADGWSTQRLLDAVEAKTGYRRLIEMDEVVLDLEAGRVLHRGDDLSELDGVIVKKIARDYTPDALDRVDILQVLGDRGVRVFSPPASMYPLINRLSGTVKLRLGGIPMPATQVTECASAAAEIVRSFGAAVAKPLYTSKARGMVILRAEDPELDARVAAFQADNQVMYLQKFVDIPGRDLGVVFLGGEYLATYARVSGGSWSTSTSKGGKYERHDPSPEIIELARRAQALFDLDFTCVDVVETAEGPKVFEVSAFGGFRGLLHACEVDAAARYADYALTCLREGKRNSGSEQEVSS